MFAVFRSFILKTNGISKQKQILIGKSRFVYSFCNEKTKLILGAIFDRYKKLNSVILDYAVKTANENILSGSDIELGFSPEILDDINEFGAAESVCRLLDVCKLAVFRSSSI